MQIGKQSVMRGSKVQRNLYLNESVKNDACLVKLTAEVNHEVVGERNALTETLHLSRVCSSHLR